jgi:ABC-type multidrug transport system ATPase subunit
MTASAIVVKDVAKRYRRGGGLNGFSLSVPVGSTTGLVGCNGAGKTTLMMVIAGFVLPDSGTVDILGGGPFDAAVHGGRLAILPQDSELPLDAGVRELLERYARLQGMAVAPARKAADELLEAFNLEDHSGKRIRQLSHGMRKRVMVAQAFLGNPKVVMLDEPLSGLDPVEADRMRAFLISLRGKVTLVISSHQLDDVQKLCTHVAFVEAGKVVRLETMQALTSDVGRVVYELRRPPTTLPSIAGVSVRQEGCALIAEFNPELTVEAVNAAIIPQLLDSGLVSVVSGRTLADAYLGNRSELKLV